MSSTFSILRGERDSNYVMRQPYRRTTASDESRSKNLSNDEDSACSTRSHGSPMPSRKSEAMTDENSSDPYYFLDEDERDRNSGLSKGHKQQMLYVKASSFANPLEPEDSAQERSYTDGGIRVVMTNDGAKQCLTLLLTEDFICDVNRLKHNSRVLSRSQQAGIDAEINANCIEDRIDTLANFTLARAESQEGKDQIQREIEQARSDFQIAEELRDKLKEELVPLRQSFDTSVEFLQTTLEQSLGQAGLLESEETHVGSVGGVDQTSTTMNDPESIERNAEELRKRAVTEELYQAQLRLREARMLFDSRQTDYKRKLAQFEAKSANESETRSNFDRRQLQHAQRLTRNLIDAEESHKVVVLKTAVAGQAHLSPNNYAALQYDDGSVLSEDWKDTSQLRLTGRNSIEAWRSACIQRAEAPDKQEGPPADIDNCNLRPVEIKDSISLIDFEGYAQHISVWRNHTTKLRENRILPSESEGLGTVTSRLGPRRRSI